MAAAPRNLVLTFQGQSGKIYTYSAYASDVANAFTTWNLVGTAGANDTTFIQAPENIVLVDASVATGLTDTTSGTFFLDDAPLANSIMPWAPIVNTLPTRSFPRVGIKAGRKVQIKQNA